MYIFRGEPPFNMVDTLRYQLLRCCYVNKLYSALSAVSRRYSRTTFNFQSIKEKYLTMSEYCDIVYKSVDSILNVLKQPENYGLDPVRQLVATYETIKKEETAKHTSDNLRAFIVLEGLDGCGKSTMTKRLGSSLRAHMCNTPPKCLVDMRPLFDGPEYKKLRPLFYSLGNYIAALQIRTILQTKPVVLDRFWYSTACFAIAQAIEDQPEKYHMPPVDDEIFTWPKDLLVPDMVLFLSVSERVRKLRLGGRGELTMQENLLAAKQLFRSNVIELYKRTKQPKTIFVNAERTKGKTEQELFQHLQNVPDLQEVVSRQIRN